MSRSEAALKATLREKTDAVRRRKPGGEPADAVPSRIPSDRVPTRSDDGFTGTSEGRVVASIPRRGNSTQRWGDPRPFAADGLGRA